MKKPLYILRKKEAGSFKNSFGVYCFNNGFNLAQISNEELACLICGEGMRSPKVTSGTTAAFGGVTKILRKYKNPIGYCADGK